MKSKRSKSPSCTKTAFAERCRSQLGAQKACAQGSEVAIEDHAVGRKSLALFGEHRAHAPLAQFDALDPAAINVVEAEDVSIRDKIPIPVIILLYVFNIL